LFVYDLYRFILRIFVSVIFGCSGIDSAFFVFA